MNSRLTIDQAMDRGAFLGRLWAHFGPAQPRDGGFEYTLLDKETSMSFTAYAGARGPSYGGEVEQRQALMRVVEALEQVLDDTKPVDCAIEYAADAGYGGGKWVLGWRDGRSFDVPDRRNRRAPGHIERRHRAR